MEVVFVLCDFLRTSCIEVFARMRPLLQNFYQSFIVFIQENGGAFYEDFLKLFFWFDLCYTWKLILKTIQENWIVIIAILALTYHLRKKKLGREVSCRGPEKIYSLGDICNLIKKCERPSFVSNVLYVLEENDIDFNTRLPSSKSGLTPFLCACISGSKELVEYMLEHGANIKSRSFYHDSPIHIATFACASQGSRHDFSVLVTLINSGCDINSKNWIGNTPLCVAASYDKGELIRFLIAQGVPCGNYDVCGQNSMNIINNSQVSTGCRWRSFQNSSLLACLTFGCFPENNDCLDFFLISRGADPSICNKDGIYPIDFATNAGHQHLTSLLRFKVSDPHVWDFIEPHTPPRIKLGLQTPCKKHLVDSSFTMTSKRKLNTFRTPRPGRCLSNEVYRKSKR